MSLFYNFTSVKMRGLNKLFRTKKKIWTFKDAKAIVGIKILDTRWKETSDKGHFLNDVTQRGGGGCSQRPLTDVELFASCRD